MEASSVWNNCIVTEQINEGTRQFPLQLPTEETSENCALIIPPGHFPPRIIDLPEEMTPGHLQPRTIPIRVIAPRRLYGL